MEFRIIYPYIALVIQAVIAVALVSIAISLRNKKEK